MAERVYLDHAATSPMIEVARNAWLEASTQQGNPSSLHTSGRAARRIVEEARESIAADLHARPSAVIFTAGGTESDNLAIKGLYWQARARITGEVAIVTSRIEHHAVLDPVLWLHEHEQARIDWLDVDDQGFVTMEVFREVLDRAADVGVCSVMWANNEVGTIQPVHEMAALCAQRGIPFHTDAVQALGQIPINVTDLGATAVTIASHKLGGPFGVGALIIDPYQKVTPLIHGGGQERDIRSGTFDAAATAGFAAAVHAVVTDLDRRVVAMRERQRQLIQGILTSVPGARLSGPGLDRVDARLPGNVHVTFDGCEGDAILMLLDAAGIDVSTGSACTAGVPEPSHVLLAMGADNARARGTLRFSLSPTTTASDIDRVLEVLPGAVERAQRAGLVGGRT